MTVGFFPDFAFSNGQRSELRARLSARGLSAEVVTDLEQLVAELKGQYGDVKAGLPSQAPTPVAHRDALAALRDAFQKCSTVLETTTEWTLNALEVASKSEVRIHELQAAIREYAAAAEKMAGRTVVKGASKESHVAVAVANVLARHGIPLDKTANGRFVIATVAVFEAMGINKSYPLNNVRRALQLIEKYNLVS